MNPRFGAALAFLLGLCVSVTAVASPPSFNGKRKPYTVISPVTAAPLTPMYTAKGGITNLGRYRGKVVLLNIWATWCPACLHEMPALDRLQGALGGRHFAVVTLSVDEGGIRQVLPYLKRLGIRNLPAFTDPAGRVAKALQIHEGLPWSFVIDAGGRVRGYLMGAADWDSAPARRLLEYYISGK